MDNLKNLILVRSYIGFINNWLNFEVESDFKTKFRETITDFDAIKAGIIKTANAAKAIYQNVIYQINKTYQNECIYENFTDKGLCFFLIYNNSATISEHKHSILALIGKFVDHGYYYNKSLPGSASNHIIAEYALDLRIELLDKIIEFVKTLSIDEYLEICDNFMAYFTDTTDVNDYDVKNYINNMEYHFFPSYIFILQS